jgi:hypothetical protein
VSSLLHPVGPQPPSVYWFRRGLLLFVALGLVVAVMMLTGGGGQGDDAAAAGSGTSREPAAPASGDPDPGPTGAAPTGAVASQTPPPKAPSGPTASSTTAGSVATCDAASLAVTVEADAESYAPRAVPRLAVTIRNEGSKACAVDVGSPDAVELVVTSGKDRIWSSDDCQPDAETRFLTLQPGDEEVQSMSWQRGRSAQGCPTGLPELTPGTYQVTARAGEVSSSPVPFTLQ